MSVNVGTGLEAGGVPEQRIAGGTDDGVSGVCRSGCQPSTGNPESVDVADPGFDDISEKSRGLGYPAQSEQLDDVVLERQKGNTESILLFAGLLSATISLFVIEIYNTSLSPNVADQAVAWFNQVTSLEQPLPLSLEAVLLEQSSSVVRAITLWLLSLGLNVICAIWLLWQQRWQQSMRQSGGPHTPTRRRPHLFPGIFGKGHPMVEANWVLLHTSVILFFVGLVDFLFQINKTITWILLGYLTPLAFVYAAATLRP